MTPRPTSASIPLTLTLNITGTVEHISASMSDHVRVETIIDDIAIAYLLFDTYAASTSPRVLTHDLLEGVDTSSPAVQRLLSNILAVVNTEAAEALADEAS